MKDGMILNLDKAAKEIIWKEEIALWKQYECNSHCTKIIDANSSTIA